jgi:hypothetical protein
MVKDGNSFRRRIRFLRNYFLDMKRNVWSNEMNLAEKGSEESGRKVVGGIRIT